MLPCGRANRFGGMVIVSQQMLHVFCCAVATVLGAPTLAHTNSWHANHDASRAGGARDSEIGAR
jgi:hypothetical protein